MQRSLPHFYLSIRTSPPWSFLSMSISPSFLPLSFSSSPLMASSDPLVVCRIIGDVVDVFVPRMTMNVYYGPKHVTNGCNIKPSIATSPPRVTLTDHSNELYTLVCKDFFFPCVLHYKFLIWSFYYNSIFVFILWIKRILSLLLVLSMHVGFWQVYLLLGNDGSWCTKSQWTLYAWVGALVSLCVCVCSLLLFSLKPSVLNNQRLLILFCSQDSNWHSWWWQSYSR